MLGDHLEDFSIDVPELVQMVARLSPDARKEMASMMQGYLQMAHYAFCSYDDANFPAPYLADLIETNVTSEPYQY